MQTRLFAILGLAALTIAASTAAPAATRAETTTYVDGNLAGVSPNTGGTLLFSDDKAMFFRTGLSTVTVPYANISHAELGATKETAHDVPLYKPWKHFGGKTETQLLIVNFKNEAGEEKNMTLELAKGSANGVLSAIHSRTANNPAPEKAGEKTAVATAEPTPAAEPVKVASSETPRKLSKKEAKLEAQQEAQKEARLEAEKAAAAKSEKSAGWWGDDYWKTSRNADKWSTKAPTAASNNEQR
jgi:hypothetical protein